MAQELESYPMPPFDRCLQETTAEAAQWKLTLAVIGTVAKQVRQEMTARYPLPLYGHCIEATDRLIVLLKEKGFNAVAVEGWCAYENPDYGTDRPFDEHTWCELHFPEEEDPRYVYPHPEDPLVVDVTMDQFQGGFYKKLPEIHVGLQPDCFTYEKPVWLLEDPPPRSQRRLKP